MAKKWWAIPVPAAAVTQEPQVVTTFIGPKASVAGFVNFCEIVVLNITTCRKNCKTRDREESEVFWGER